MRKNSEYEVFQPEKLNVQNILKQATEQNWTRADFNREIKSAGRYLKKGVELPTKTKTGVWVSKYELREFSIFSAVNERRKTLERKKFSPLTGTKHMITDNNLKKGHAIPKSLEELRRGTRGYKKATNKGYQSESYNGYKMNYLGACYKYLGGFAVKIVDILRNVSGKIMFDATENDTLSIEFIYTMRFAKDVAERIYNTWKTYLNGGSDIEWEDLEESEYDEDFKALLSVYDEKVAKHQEELSRKQT